MRVGILFIMVAAIACRAHADDLKHYTFQVAGHINYLSADDYFESNALAILDQGSDLGAGLEVGVFRTVGETNRRLGLEAVNYSTHSANVASLCNSSPCTLITELKHPSAFFTVDQTFHQNHNFAASFFGGLSYVLAKGELKGQSWSNPATGLHAGMRTSYNVSEDLDVYAAFRLHGFKIEVGNKDATVLDSSLIVGLMF